MNGLISGARALQGLGACVNGLISGARALQGLGACVNGLISGARARALGTGTQSERALIVFQKINNLK